MLRTLPGFATLAILKRVSQQGTTPHIHLHPWEFDSPGGIGLGPLRRAALFAGSRRVPLKVSRILGRYRGTAIEEVLDVDRAHGAESPAVMEATA